MNIKTSHLNARPSNLGLLRCPANAFRPAFRADARKAPSIVCSSSLDPWKTLGVSYDADEKQIKKAYRKLALDNHPDLRGSEAAARFVKIQEAYEVVTGKRRGTTSETAPRSSTAAGTWDFHDWYWKFTAGKRWDQQRKKAPHSPTAEAARPRPLGAPEEALRAQLAGLRRKAAFRSRSSPPTPTHQQGSAAATGKQQATSCEGFAAEKHQAAAEPASAGFKSSTKEADGVHVGHDTFAESQLAGLKRRARNRQYQQQAAPPPSHSTASETLHNTMNAAAEMQKPQTSAHAEDQDLESMAAAGTMYEMKATAPALAMEDAAAADGEPAWREQLRCARDFMAEVQLRTTSSNIVAATFTGLRARLAPTIAELAHRTAAVASAGPINTSGAEGTPLATGERAHAFGRSALEAGAASGEEARRVLGASGAGFAGEKESCGQQGPAQLGQQLASQLAGLKRRAAIRQYPA